MNLWGFSWALPPWAYIPWAYVGRRGYFFPVGISVGTLQPRGHFRGYFAAPWAFPLAYVGTRGRTWAFLLAFSIRGHFARGHFNFS